MLCAVDVSSIVNAGKVSVLIAAAVGHIEFSMWPTRFVFTLHR